MEVQARTAAKFLGITDQAFYKRNYEPSKVIDGKKFYDTDKLYWDRKRRSDKGKKKCKKEQ